VTGPLARRGLLQTGALSGGLALVGLWPRAGNAAPLAAGAGRTGVGTIAAHVRLDLARGGAIRLAELDASSRLVRELGTAELPLGELYDGGVPAATGDPLARACARAQALGVRAAAREWGVAAVECIADPSGITHPASGRRVPYRAWIDVI
jgi:hypothetical protein